MKTITLLGAGKIGRMISHFLGNCGDYRVRVCDASKDAAASAAAGVKHADALAVDFRDPDAIAKSIDGAFGVLSAAPFFLNPVIAERAKAKGVHYLDLTEDVAVTQKVKELAKGASVAFIPQCGLAPGFITIGATHVIEGLDSIHDVRMRVGALPRFPANRLKYNLTWSTDGLINEYLHPCEAVAGGKFVTVPALEQLEPIIIEGVEYEAFNTSGGLGTLAETLAGKVKNLSYKSIRYPGHCELMKFLLHDLKLGERPEVVKEIFERALASTEQDRVVIYVTASGLVGGRLVERAFTRTILHREIDGKQWTGIQITTAAGICAVLDLLSAGKIPTKGFVRQEDVKFGDFISNRFGKHYGKDGEGAAA